MFEDFVEAEKARQARQAEVNKARQAAFNAKCEAASKARNRDHDEAEAASMEREAARGQFH